MPARRGTFSPAFLYRNCRCAPRCGLTHCPTDFKQRSCGRDRADCRFAVACATSTGPRSNGEAQNARAAEPDRSHPCEEGELEPRSEEHTSELQSRLHLVCRLLLEKKKK